jgi:release factor glutamine methyltransferase
VTARDAVAHAERRLAAAGVETPRVDAEWLVAHVAQTTRTRLFDVRDVDADRLDRLLRRREAREPLAYVLGEWGFRRLTLKTDARALIPRPETETLVERALALIASVDAPRVLDVGVGGGAVALAIADEHPSARVTGVDTSPDAVELARENAEALALPIELRAGGVAVAGEGWDLVVSNPPYVSEQEWEQLQPEIRGWEPRAALVGIGFHETLARMAKTRALVVEVGDGQASSVERTFANCGYVDITITNDLTGRQRVVEGRRV